MASTKQLYNGQKVLIGSGPLQGMQAEIIDTTLRPGGPGSKIRIKVIPTTGDPWEETIIPKLLRLPNAAPNAAPKVSATTSAGHSAPQATLEITSLDDPILDRFRTTRPNLLKSYVTRDLPGGKTDIDVMTSYWERRDSNGYASNVGLVGDTQSGKTMLVEVMSHVIAKKMGLSKPLPMYTLSGSSAITDHDLFGQYRPDEFGSLRWMEGIVSLACRFGGILYLDEVNAMPGNVTSALHPILDDRRQFINIRKPVADEYGMYAPEVVNVSRDLWIVCTYNPGYAGMSKTNEAFANRFRWLPWDYDDKVESKLIKSPTIRMLGQALRLARETRAITTPVGTSALQRLEEDILHLDVDYALWAFMGQFTSKAEKAKVDAILTDRSIKALIENEFVKTPATPVEEPF